MSESVAEMSAELQRLQRKRAVVIQSRIRMANRLQAIIAGTLGYHSDMDEKDRKKFFADAAKLIKAVAKGTAKHEYGEIIRGTGVGIKAFNDVQGDLEKGMVELAGKLPVASWVNSPELRGFGLLTLAIVIGETGDLANYANPAKAWKRMGCAPWSFDGHTCMGATWKSPRNRPCALPGPVWADFGYSPRRRSIAYLIGDNIVKLNGTGPYRQRYDAAKLAAAVKHPDWKPQHCHLHGMLVATKRLLRDLWCVWNNRPMHVGSGVTDDAIVLSA